MAMAATGERRLSGERLFFTSMAAVVLLSTFLGFAPTYYLRGLAPLPHPVEPLVPLVFVHGLVFSAWILLFAAQTLLVAKGQVLRHRALGRAGFALVALMIPLAVAVGIGGIHRPLTAPPGVPPLSWAAVPLLDVPLFSGLILAALAARSRPQTHKRLMLCAMVDMLRPSLGRLIPMLGLTSPVAALFGPLAFLVPLVAWDLATLKRVHPATLAGTVAVIAVTVATPFIWATPAWLAMAGWLSAL